MLTGRQSSGNGGTQALEDAVSLATCLSIAGSKEKIPDATRVHNLLRFERVSYLQAFGVMNRQKQNTSKSGEDGKKKILHVGKLLENMPVSGSEALTEQFQVAGL
jgi:2-polyprenyl-6-methoxyphenol hydroxylase-like FAD-dependent oxidoreductase